MNQVDKRFRLPKEEHKFEDTIKPIKGCNIISSRASEDVEGPEIEEVYVCPCGDITLRQKSIITNIDNPEKSSIEIVHLESNGCVLQ
jgi:hypothetical protein